MGRTGRTIGEALAWASGELSKAGVPEPGGESEFIVMHLLGAKRHELFLNAQRAFGEKEDAALLEAVRRRAAREPSQYIFGEAEWRGMSLRVTRDVLIPRPETELLAEEARRTAGRFGDGITVIDLCTGSGCIAISAAREIPGSTVYATDISGAALGVAMENAEKASVAGKITFLKGDLFEPLPGELMGRVHMILSNPPYVPAGEIERLDPEVRDFEPRQALSGGGDGLDFIRRILDGAPGFLAPGGWLVFEMGYGQSKEVAWLAEAAGAYECIEIIKDFAMIDRILKARLKA